MIRESRASPWLNVGGQATVLSHSLVRSVPDQPLNPDYLPLVWTLWRVEWRYSATRERRGESHQSVVLAIVTLSPFVLALGPRLATDPEPYHRSAAAVDPRTRLPVFTAGRRPQLFYFIAMLAFGVLFAFALRELFLWLQQVIARRQTRGVRMGIACRANRAGCGHAGCHARAVRRPAPEMPRRSRCTPPFYRDVLREGPELVRDPRTATLLAGYRRGLADLSDHARQADLQWQHLADHKLESLNIFVKHATFYRDSSGRASRTNKRSITPRRRRTSSRPGLHDIRHAAPQLLSCALHHRLSRRATREEPECA